MVVQTTFLGRLKRPSCKAFLIQANIFYAKETALKRLGHININ
jgi:hypothetical protein